MGAEDEAEARDGRATPDPVAVDGVVTEALPHAMYRVEIDAGRRVLAHASHDAHRNFVRILVGDRVRVELSPVDRTRGRIVRRHQGGKA